MEVLNQFSPVPTEPSAKFDTITDLGKPPPFSPYFLN